MWINKFRSLTLLTMLASSSVFAFSFSTPFECKDSGISFFKNMLHLKAENVGKSKMFVIYNHSHEKIMVDRYSRTNPGASAGWGSVIDSGHWSVILIPDKYFSIQCKIKSGQFQYSAANCKDFLDACYVPSIDSHDQDLLTGGYWVTENVSSDDLVSKIRDRGFWLGR